jgi:hypothetical protein
MMLVRGPMDILTSNGVVEVLVDELEGEIHRSATGAA